jgi:hypothetical protein
LARNEQEPGKYCTQAGGALKFLLLLTVEVMRNDWFNTSIKQVK